MIQNLLTYYHLLGVATNASTDEIIKAYKEKAKIHHPDANNGSATANEMFNYITLAKDCLTNPAERLEYDYIIGVKQKPEIPKPKFPERNKNNDNLDAAVGLGLLGLVVGVAIGSSGKSGKK